MPISYDEKIKEEARALYLQGLTYRMITGKIREQYKNTITHSTVRAWALKGEWPDMLKKQREVIQSKTNQNTTQSIEKHIKTLRAVQNKFIAQLDSDHYEIKANEMVNIIRLMLQLEGAKNVKEVLIEEIAEKLPKAMKKAKIPQKKINLTIRYWIEMVQEM